MRDDISYDSDLHIPDDFFIFNFYFVFCLFRAAPAAYGGSQARSLFGAVAAGLPHSYSNTRFELSL